MVGIFLQPFFYTLRFLYYIAGNEAVGYLVAVYERIVIDASFKRFRQFLFRHIRQFSHIRQVDTTELVERGGERFLWRIDMADLVKRKRDRVVEDV